MRYIIVLGDGMADYKQPSLGNRTPLEVAHKPNIDYLCHYGKCGLIKTIPNGMNPASDVANLSVLGYDPTIYYSGRSPLEALSMGVEMADKDVAIRTNLVTLSDDEKLTDKIMLDYSAQEISTDEARALITAIQEKLGDDRFSFHSGISYRHCLIDKSGNKDTVLTPPHDISERRIGDYLPKGKDADIFRNLIEKSIEILKGHPINKERIHTNKRPANAIWFWGLGTKPTFPSFSKKTKGLKGAVISAVDLIKGIAKGTEMKVYEVEGATGNIDTNYMGKARAVIDALKDGYDFVYLHIEAPDECGHRGEAENKVKAIESVDKVTGFIKASLDDMQEDYVIAVLSDHATPLCLRTHTTDPVPYLIYNSTIKTTSKVEYNEEDSALGEFLTDGGKLTQTMFNWKGDDN